MYKYIYENIYNEKEVMNLKYSKEGYMGEFGRRKEKGKTLLIIVTKVNHENKQTKKTELKLQENRTEC